MAKVLIPRSDSVSAKVIEPSDFESMFSDDIINDYVKSGFTLTAGSGLAVNIAVGKARLKGLFIHNDSASSKSSLTASNTNYIYVTLTRDTNSEAESWDFTSNTTGSTPTDSLFIGTATTNGSSVTAVDMTDVETISTQFMKRLDHNYGDGSDGDVTISSNTTLATTKQYNNLTVDSGVTVTGSGSNLVIKIRGTLTVNGTIHMNDKVTIGSTETGAGGGSTSSRNGSGGAGGDATGKGDRPFGIGSTGGAGGDGGAGGSYGGSGGSGGDGSGVLGAGFINNNISTVNAVLDSLPFGYGGGGGAGGGGGGGGAGYYVNTTGSGGVGSNGGNGGGTLIIISDTITIGGSGLISANGGTGSTGGAGGDGLGTGGNNAGGGGGGAGGGGGGGLVILIYKTLTNNGSVTVTGGVGGTGGAVGGGGGSPSTGSNGTAGSAGVFKSLQIT